MAVEPICTCVVGVVIVVALAAVLWLICLIIVCLWLFITHLRAFLMSARARKKRHQRTDQKGLTNGWGWRAKADDATPAGRLAKQNEKENENEKKGDQNAFRNVYYNGGMRGRGRDREKERETWRAPVGRWGVLKWEWNFFPCAHNQSINRACLSFGIHWLFVLTIHTMPYLT